MRILLDTDILLWALIEPKRLSIVARTAIEEAGNDILFSAASIWEIAIKSTLKKRGFRFTAEEIAGAARSTGFAELPIRAAAAARVAELPPLHRNPFDRLLIAQAMVEPAHFYTADALLKKYSELVCVI
ncbi:MAG: type II toxin-antitoxin system VapC family toxin [Rhizomicrobium sp.]